VGAISIPTVEASRITEPRNTLNGHQLRGC